ncbi:MAG TPA: GAF and ANTAR domain-containing protein [Propionibacteriaceae bacterium]|nr:GAF and ANTAR domain-containing protein [Propionibacteriaceae bacterium]
MVTREIRIAQVFVRLADTLVGDFDVAELMLELAEACIELLDVDAAGLMLVDGSGELRLVASAPDMMHDLEVFELQSEEGPCLDTMRTGKAVINVDVMQAQERWPRFTAEALEAGIRSTHALPLRLRGDLIGAVNIFSKAEQHLSDGDVALGQALADVATISLLQQRTGRDPLILAEQLQAALNTRILIEQAKGVLAERSGLHPAATFHYMRAYAQQHIQPLHSVARQVIDGRLSSTKLIAEGSPSEP